MPPTYKPVQWVRYDPGATPFEFLRLSIAAELAHRRLADYHWRTGEWASVRDGNAAALCRVSPRRWPAVLAELARLGWRVQAKRLCNSGVQLVRDEAVTFLRSVRTRGRMGARRRWDGQGARERKPAAKPSGPAGPLLSRAVAEPCLSDSPAIAQPSVADSPAIAQPSAADSSAIAQPWPSKSKSKGKTDSTRHNTVNRAERLTFIVSAQEKSAQGEKEFLKEVEETFARWSPKFAAEELTNWGGWWRNRYRENAAKARTVLADLASMIREGRVTGNPGAAAVDLWGRLP